MQDIEFTVIGAGIAGLSTAIALALRGAKVVVLEQSDAIRDVGGGIQISPNGAAVLAALGLGPALQAAAGRALAVRLLDGYGGGSVLHMDLPQSAAKGFFLLHRADLIGLLRSAAEAAGAELHLSQQVTQIDLSGPRPLLTLGQGGKRPAQFVIGADGLRSGLRAALNGAAAPFFTHQVAWRALIPATPQKTTEVEVHMGAGRHLVSYPLRSGTMRNIVAVEERRKWAEESWTLRADPTEMRLAFEGFNPQVQSWLAQADEVWLWGLFRHPVAKNWFGRNAAILGDAAHPTLPFLAQGANMALEDAWVLADCLDRLGPEKGLPAYQSAREKRCTRIVEAANTNARAYHLRAPWRSLAHLGLKLGSKIAPSLPLKRFDWLYNHDVTARNITAIQ